MIFKINKRVNLLFETVVFLELIVLLIDDLARIRNISAFNFNYYIAIGDQIVWTLMLLYIINVLGFLREKKFIRVGFFIYMVVEFVFAASVIIVERPSSFILTIDAVLAVLILLTSIVVFVVSLLIQSRLIFKPIILYSTTLVVYTTLEVLFSIILPLFEKIDSGAVTITMIERDVRYLNMALSAAMPVAVIWLANRVNTCFRNPQTFGT